MGNPLPASEDKRLEILFSAERPPGHTGNWAKIDRQATAIFTRFRSYDWENEVDPVLSIECLDPVPPKPRGPSHPASRTVSQGRRSPRSDSATGTMRSTVSDRTA